MSRLAPPHRDGIVRASFAALIAALSACAVVPPGIRAADPDATDRVAARAPPAGWKRVAVLPFGGDPAHRRPAEELVALRVQRSTNLELLTPFAMQRSNRSRGLDASAALADADRWAAAYVEAPAAGPPRDELRALAKEVAVDALVLGRVAPGGASVDLVLVDGASGDAVAALRRAGSARAAGRGIHELAMSSTERALEDLVMVLQARPGEAPRVAMPGEHAASDAGDDP